jgi:hypothetical protein
LLWLRVRHSLAVLLVLVVFFTEKPPLFKRVRALKMLGEGLGAGIIEIGLGFRSATQKFESMLKKKKKRKTSDIEAHWLVNSPTSHTRYQLFWLLES